MIKDPPPIEVRERAWRSLIASLSKEQAIIHKEELIINPNLTLYLQTSPIIEETDIDHKVESLEDLLGIKRQEGAIETGYNIKIYAKLLTPGSSLILHWGIGHKYKEEWKAPPSLMYPPFTQYFDEKSCETTFYRVDEDNPHLLYITITVQVGSNFKALNFVLKEVIEGRDIWYNNGGKNYQIPLRIFGAHIFSSKSDEVVRQIIECEADYPSWTLMHRYNKCSEILHSLDPLDIVSSSYIFIWLRFSALRQLDWQRKYNTKPKDLSHAQNIVTANLASFYCRGVAKQQDINYSKHKMHESATFLTAPEVMKQCLMCIGKGSINGQLVRDNILVIIHRHKIGESSHHFYEQWHQKLHNNTTPDDIVICEALLAYLRSNDMSKYWGTLHAGGVTKQRLQSFERRILVEPYFAPHLIHDFEEFLGILKQVHSATDLDANLGGIYYLLGDQGHKITDVLGNRVHWDKLKQIERVTILRNEIRYKINNSPMSDTGNVKNLLYADLSLEQYLRSLVESIIHQPMELRHYLWEMGLLLDNLTASFSWIELVLTKREWDAISREVHDQLHDRSKVLKFKAILNRVKRCIAHISSVFSAILQPAAEKLGYGCNCEKPFVELFSEEIIRGSLFFALAMIIKKIEQCLKGVVEQEEYVVISPKVMAMGRVVFSDTLMEVQDVEYPEPTILITKKISGEEEVPKNVTGILLHNPNEYPDILAHVSVRARNNNCLLFVCMWETKALTDGYKVVGKPVKLVPKEGPGLDLTVLTEESFVTLQKELNMEGETYNLERKLINSKIVKVEKYSIQAEEFNRELVGAKSNNLNKIRDELPVWIKTPKSMALPYGVFEAICGLPENNNISTQISKLESYLSTRCDQSKNILAHIQQLLSQLKFPVNKEGEDLAHELQAFGIQEMEEMWRSIVNVFRSKYNERALIATRKIGIALNYIRMAVLIQEIIPAEYAFVIHTKNPVNGNKQEIFAQVVAGLGETLVGDYQGQSFTFIYNKRSGMSKVINYLNKSECLRVAGGFIARSDSNAEDLEGFAGAGLFDSYPTQYPLTQFMDYTQVYIQYIYIQSIYNIYRINY